MSTRSAIATIDADFATTGNFTGRYHHWDGYPSGLGSGLYKMMNGQNYLGKTIGSRDAVAKFLLQDHPAGFSSVNGVHKFEADAENADNLGNCKYCWKPAMPKKKAARAALEKEYKQYAYCDNAGEPTIACFCHHGGVRRSDEPDNVVTQADASDAGCEWVYAFDLANAKMYVLSSVNEDGSKMIGMFGSGNPNGKWKPVACIDLDGEEPDWDDVQYGLAKKVYEHYRTLPHHVQYAENADDRYAYCPRGHKFHMGWRYPGEVCEGRSLNKDGKESGMSPFKSEGCGHVFALPDGMLTGAGEIKVLATNQDALNP